MSSVADDVLQRMWGLVEAVGLPIAIAAWVSVFAGCLALGLILRSRAGVPAAGRRWRFISSCW